MMLRRREDELARHRENQGRLAQVYADYVSQGQGTVEFEERIDFGCTYIQQPWPSYGAFIDVDGVRDLLGIAPGEDCPLPVSTGVVTEWDRNERGHFVGCWVAISVLFPTYDIRLTADAQIEVEHYFSFSAIALKDVPAKLTD